MTGGQNDAKDWESGCLGGRKMFGLVCGQEMVRDPRPFACDLLTQNVVEC
jgi:hypothetical protein